MRSLNIAHRGFSGQYPENTLLAFEQAYQAGADGIELDVRLTKDGEVVVFHDPTIDRMTGKKGAVNGYDLNELTSYPLTHSLEKNQKQQYIPTLSDYLIWAENKPILSNIELKNKEDVDNDLVLKVAEVLQKFELEGTVLFSTFQKKSIERIREVMPDVKTGLLLSKYDEPAIHLAKEMGADYVHLKAVNLTVPLIELAHDLGLGINVWTVNGIKELEKINNIGVEGIITDFPDRLRDIQYKK